jgi:processive 1,2-diacylglycerol beta-glucosyltransferase
MIDLYNVQTNQLLGSVEADLQVVIDALEEESAEDQDYYIDKATIEYMADGRLSDHLLNLLRGAMGSSDGIEIRWQRR